MSHNYCKRTPPPTKAVYKNSEATDHLLAQALTLPNKDVLALCMELVKQSTLSSFQMNTLKNLITKVSNEWKNIEGPKPLASEQHCTVDSRAPQASGQHRNVDSRAPSTSTPMFSTPASKTSLIVRSDLIIESASLCIDMEKIIDKKHMPVAGDLAIVDLKGNLVMWCYVKRTDVCRFNTALTGLNAKKMEMGLEEEIVREILQKVLNKNKLIGAQIKNDLIGIGYFTKSTPNLPNGCYLEEIHDFFLDNKDQPIRMALLGEHFTGESFQDSTHSSIRDARMTAICYKKMQKMKLNGFSRFRCAEFDEVRDADREARKTGKDKKSGVKWDRCTCQLKPLRVKKQNWSSVRGVDLKEYD